MKVHLVSKKGLFMHNGVIAHTLLAREGERVTQLKAQLTLFEDLLNTNGKQELMHVKSSHH
jgi:hypothetical protein